MSLEPEVLAAIRAGIPKVKCPGGNDKVYKDECMYTFDNPYSPTGLFVNLSTWHGVAHDFLEFDSQRSGNQLYVHLKYTKVPKEVEKAEDSSKDDGPTKLAIGVDGGFQLDSQKYDIIKDYSLVVLRPDGRVSLPWPNTAVPEFVGRAVQAVIDHQGASLQAEAQAWVDDEKRPVSKYAEGLEQLDNGLRISNNPSTWKCADSGATDNLWLNLSTGYIGSGRPQFLLSGVSGGTGAALRHYEETGGKYPLVVKLGTITPTGADVYSYAPDEDCMVEDPKLAEHLAHWGIDIMKLEKTQKTLAEMEVETNKSWEFSRITEAGAKLVPLRGPGYVGLVNLGNSCYMNSTLQLLFTLPELKQHYHDRYRDLVMGRAVPDPASDHLTQVAKLSLGLLSDRYAPPATEEESRQAGEKGGDTDFTTSVEPRMFKTLFGRGHPEFSSGRQQDASEYLQHLLTILQRAERVGFDGQYYTDSLFRFKMEDRYQCLESSAVKYVARSEGSLEVTIPLEAAINRAAVAEYQERKQKRQKLEEAEKASGGSSSGGEKEEEEVHPVVPWSACLEGLLATETLDDWYSSALQRKGLAGRTARFKTFPKYLLVQLKRYFVDQTWTPRKLEATVDMPDLLDLTPFRSTGLQPGEVPLPQDDDAAAPASSSAAPAPLQPDAALAAQLEPMGFSANAVARALVATHNTGAEAAAQWLFEHMEDADVNDPLPAPSTAATAAPSSSSSSSSEPDPDTVANLSAMLGFTDAQVKAALRATNNDSERAADWLFSHADDMDAAVASVAAQQQQGAGGGAGAGEDSDGPGRYRLVGFISHIGKNTGSGHYVAHIRKEGRWVIFDDQKVALSEHPPRGLGYLYLYARHDEEDGMDVA